MKQLLDIMDNCDDNKLNCQEEITSPTVNHLELEKATEVKNFKEVNDDRKKETNLDLLEPSANKSSENESLSKVPPRLVQHCGAECMLSEKIVDKLLSRMMKLENEKTELHAANRSWSVQYKLMKDQYLKQIEVLKDEIKGLKKEKEEGKCSRNASTKPSCHSQVDVLAHQAQIYKEDFLEERKARSKAHSQIEALKSELKREKKSRAKLAALVQQQQQNSNEKLPSPVIGTCN